MYVLKTLFWTVPSLCCFVWVLSSCGEHSLVAMLRLLFAVTFLVAGAQAPKLGLSSYDTGA